MDCKTCNRCGIEKPLDSFGTKKDRRQRVIIRSRCKQCEYDVRRERFHAKLGSAVSGEKRCYKCEAVKPLHEFYVDRNKYDGLASECVECRLTYEKERYQQLLASGLSVNIIQQDTPPGYKQCRGCGEVKPTSGFFRHPDMPDGRLNFCRSCHSARVVAAERIRKLKRHQQRPQLVERLCILCERHFPESNEYFHESKKGVLDLWCRLCVEDLMNRASRSDLSVKKWPATRAYQIRLKLYALVHYSQGRPTCVCCGEQELLFLAIDHINGGGNRHRESVSPGGGFKMYVWLRREGYPSGFQIMCHNCNLAKGFYGACPHQKQEQAPVLAT